MIDELAPVTYLPMRLAGNQLSYTINAADESITDRSGLLYKLCLKNPAAYQSGDFKELIVLSGREIPPSAEDSAVYASFDVETLLDSLLTRQAPDLRQTGIMPCAGLVLPYYVVASIENNRVPVAGSMRVGPPEYVLKGQLATEQFAGWRDQFFTTYLSDTRQFLTWQPDAQRIDPEQPNWLYFLVNMTPRPQSLTLRIGVTYADGTTDTLTGPTAANPYAYTVYSIPVGFGQLNLDATERQTGKLIHSYQVWLVNEQQRRLTQVRTYYVETEPPRNVRYLIFANSLGGYDTLRCTGIATDSLGLKAVTAQRSLPSGYLPTSAELFTASKTGDRAMTINTGLQEDPANLDYLQELALSEDVYVLTQEGLVSVVPTDTAYRPREDDEDLAGRPFSFRWGKSEVGFSALPTPPTAPLRPTAWQPENPYCLIDSATGLRTGVLGAARLRLTYADTGEVVTGVRTKANVPGTIGYVAPVASALCAPLTTSFRNVATTRIGSFVRQTCPVGQAGQPATLAIAANTFGGNTADEVANRVAQAFRLLDTQAYADQFGPCSPNPYDYVVSVPAGHFHYRTNNPQMVQLACEPAGQPPLGSAWWLQGQTGPYVFPRSTTDMAFPQANGAGFQYSISAPGGGSGTARIFRNGVLMTTRPNVPYNAASYPLLDGFTVAAGDRIYMEFTHVAWA